MTEPQYPSKEWLVAKSRAQGIEITPQEAGDVTKSVAEAILSGTGIRVPNAELDHDARVRLIVAFMSECQKFDLLTKPIEAWLKIAKGNNQLGFHLVRHPVEKEWEPRYFDSLSQERDQAIKAQKEGYVIFGTHYVKK